MAVAGDLRLRDVVGQVLAGGPDVDADGEMRAWVKRGERWVHVGLAGRVEGLGGSEREGGVVEVRIQIQVGGGGGEREKDRNTGEMRRGRMWGREMAVDLEGGIERLRMSDF